MALLGLNSEEKKVKPCICGKDKKALFYRAPEMSPSYSNIELGTIIVLLIELVAPVGLLKLDAAILIPYVAAPIPAFVLLLSIGRLTKTHGLKCSLRWGYFAVTGAARFF